VAKSLGPMGEVTSDFMIVSGWTLLQTEAGSSPPNSFEPGHYGAIVSGKRRTREGRALCASETSKDHNIDGQVGDKREERKH